MGCASQQRGTQDAKINHPTWTNLIDQGDARTTTTSSIATTTRLDSPPITPPSDNPIGTASWSYSYQLFIPSIDTVSLGLYDILSIFWPFYLLQCCCYTCLTLYYIIPFPILLQRRATCLQTLLTFTDKSTLLHTDTQPPTHPPTNFKPTSTWWARRVAALCCATKVRQVAVRTHVLFRNAFLTARRPLFPPSPRRRLSKRQKWDLACHVLSLRIGLQRTDNNMDFTTWPQVSMINQKNYYT